ncbi:hypothetical protein JYT22_00270 [Endomicrobium sp. AH-315-J14]|nr:hypothetical protein [Endomicrobium sp. AH-315-J14]
MSKNAAAEIGPQLTLHVTRETTTGAFARFVQEGVEVLRDDAVEECLLGSTALVDDS